MEHLTTLEMIEDALDIYHHSLIKKIESMPEFKTLCEKELIKAVDSFPLEVKKYIYNAKGIRLVENAKWKENLGS